jgi:hypothetical protein
MECIFLEAGKDCTANLPRHAPSGWEVDDDTMKKYCVKEEFSDCPRYKAFMEYLEKGTKEKITEKKR